MAKTSSRRPQKRVSLPLPLKVNQSYKGCALSEIKIPKSKSSKNKANEIIGQERAVRAIEMGLGIRKPGYNIYVAGVEGTGRTSVIKNFLQKFANDAPPPSDWLYLYNFDYPERPLAVEFPVGEGKKFRKKMDKLLKTLKKEIPAALEGEEYENGINSYMSASNDRKSKLYNELEKLARSMGFAIKSTRLGIETIPLIDGRQLTEKEYSKLDDERKDSIEASRSKLEPEVLDFARKVRSIDAESKTYVEDIREQYGKKVVTDLIEPIAEEYEDCDILQNYFKAYTDNVIENILDFASSDEQEEVPEELRMHEEKERFKKYTANLFLDNSSTKNAPIIIENNPTYYNLFGKIEKNVEHGMYLTDFSMIKAGSIHRANGGYLVINALDIFRTHSIWDTLKRILRNQLGFIEDMGEQHSILPTSGLRPEPMPLDVKVILIGNDEIYHELYELDEEFSKIFKIKADFDYKLIRNKKNISSYVDFISSRSEKDHLLSFDQSGVSSIVEFSSRLVEDQNQLSSQFGIIKDLIIEADYVAREGKSKKITRNHVTSALDRKFYRLNQYEEHLLEMVKNEDLLLSVDGKRVGQINGLAVYDMGDYSFGKISRITCTTSVCDDGIVNIERASRLSGKIHDKGMMILTGFLKTLLARKHGFSLSASVCFEQNYGIIDGDSASIAELIAVISAFAKIPIDQSFSVTGSVNQMGEVQPIGGVNEKVEGFYRCCQILGSARKTYSVMIPYQNVQNLMLNEHTRDAVAKGKLRIYPIRHISEAFELATGVALGINDVFDDKFTKNSALEIINNIIEELNEDDDGDDEKSEKSEPSSTSKNKSKSSKK